MQLKGRGKPKKISITKRRVKFHMEENKSRIVQKEQMNITSALFNYRILVKYRKK